MSQAKRVCVIGAGPSGMSVLYHFNRLKTQRKEIPEIVCYDKQSDWGGLWKYSWETGTDGYGEPVHGSMYQGLWSNGPKEGLEFPDYTFDEHFGKAIPSYPPREVLYDYLKGRWTKKNLRPWIRFNHVVHHVTFNDPTDDFSVVVKNLPEEMGELNGPHEEIDFQTAYVADVAKEANYGFIIDSSSFLHAWVKYKEDDIITYRSRSYTSAFTGTKSPVFRTPFMQAFDDSMQNFLTPEQ